MNKITLLIRYLKYSLLCNFHSFGWKIVFANNVSLRNTKYMSIGNNVSLDTNSVLYVIEHPKYKEKSPKLVLEDNVGIGIGATVLALNSITIKKDAMIGPSCVITDFDHKYQDINTPIRKQDLTHVKSVEVGTGAWIGANTTIASGVTIGKNAVIGANSTVTKSIPDYCVAVGVPAIVIKKYDNKTKKWEKVKNENNNF